MKRSSTAKILLSAFLLICAIWIAVPKVYVHALLGHVHTTTVPTVEGTAIQAEDAKDDCGFGKYDSPVYFTIFKFINNLIPSRPKEQSFLSPRFSVPASYSGQSSALRAPPVA